MNDTSPFYSVLTKGCISLQGTKVGKPTKLSFTVIYTILIPFIVSSNLLAIIGIIKTKKNKFTVCQILFIVLFLSDLSFGAIQLPVQLHFIKKITDPTCLLTRIMAFLIVFPICMSGATLCLISIDRYLHVTQARYYKRIVTSKTLTLTIILLVAVSFMFGLLHAIFLGKRDFVKVAKLYIGLSIYEGLFLTISVFFNIALLRNVKLKIKTSSLTQATLNTSLTKTIALIVAAMVVTYIPLIIMLNIATYIFFTDHTMILKTALHTQWSLLPLYFNSTFNSVIYMAKSMPIKKFYYALIRCKKILKRHVNAGST